MAYALICCAMLCAQYCEFGLLYYLGYYVLASCLLYITLQSAFVSTRGLYKKRQELFQSVDKQRLAPLVYKVRVRSALPLLFAPQRTACKTPHMMASRTSHHHYSINPCLAACFVMVLSAAPPV